MYNNPVKLLFTCCKYMCFHVYLETWLYWNLGFSDSIVTASMYLYVSDDSLKLSNYVSETFLDISTE